MEKKRREEGSSRVKEHATHTQDTEEGRGHGYRETMLTRGRGEESRFALVSSCGVEPRKRVDGTEEPLEAPEMQTKKNKKA